MNRSFVLKGVIRLLMLIGGFATITAFVYAAGRWLVPLTSGADRAILAAINPDTYAPGFDQFFRALTDYSNLLIALPLIAWMVAYGIYKLFPRYTWYVAGFLAIEAIVMGIRGRVLPDKLDIGTGLLILVSASALVGLAAHLLYTYALYRVIPRYKTFITGLLGVVTVVATVMAATGRIWPNSVYTGVNVLLVAGCLFFLGLTAYLFHTMDDDAMRRFAWAFGLVFVSILMTDSLATNHVKEAIARPRPFSDANKPWNEGVRRIPDEYLKGSNSYPSGHTSGTFGLLTPLFWHTRNRKVRGALFSWGCLQGVSRVYTAAHFPFDCFMGGVLGFTTGTLVFFTLWGRATWASSNTSAQPASCRTADA